MQYGDPAVGKVAARFAGLAHPSAGIQVEIAGGMVRRVVDQHQMRQVAVGKMQPRVVEVAPDIAVEQQERLLAEQRQGAEDSATGFQRFTLRGIGDPPAQARTVAEIGLDLLAKPGMVYHPVLDFQDALHGPVTYDVTCLYKDAFVSWPEPRVHAALNRYWKKATWAGIPLPPSFEDFLRASDLMGVQRHLKVIGIFARICHRDGKPRYLGDVPRFFRYLETAVARRPELAELGELLASLPQGAEA